MNTKNSHATKLLTQSSQDTYNLATSQTRLSMRSILGYLNQSEWLYLLNIGNIMQISPMTIHDLYSSQSIEVELTRDSILEKVTIYSLIIFA